MTIANKPVHGILYKNECVSNAYILALTVRGKIVYGRDYEQWRYHSELSSIPAPNSMVLLGVL